MAALHREILEELGVRVELGREVPGPVGGAWPLGERYLMRVWLAEVSDGRPQPLEEHDELRWLDLADAFCRGVAARRPAHRRRRDDRHVLTCAGRARRTLVTSAPKG